MVYIISHSNIGGVGGFARDTRTDALLKAKELLEAGNQNVQITSPDGGVLDGDSLRKAIREELEGRGRSN